MWEFLQWVAAIGLSLLVIVVVLALCVAIFFAVLTGVVASFRESRKEAYSEDHFYVRLDGKWLKVVSPEPSSFETEQEGPGVPERGKKAGIRGSRVASSGFFVRNPPPGASGASDAFKGSDRPHLNIG